ncbi:hypothetical protein B0O99DRAFT_696257 [Bisporella sp. PMI_857]|nr:hypothetical protein B0O99DRAFT_696257 [Bisporella sp. PMI_857]
MRDAMNQTFFAAPQRKESQDELIYSQFYNLIKTLFDTCKVYVFNNEALENLALDPGYIRSLQQEGGSITFSKASYGIREEHCISLTMIKEISQQWRQWDLYDNEANYTPASLLYYIVPIQELLGFLYAQINKYCFFLSMSWPIRPKPILYQKRL